MERFIKALNELYIIQRNKYLKQANGRVFTAIADTVRTNSKTGASFKVEQLKDKHLAQHLKGTATYGVFASHQTKFMLFDLDFKESPVDCKYYHRKIVDTLHEFNIRDEQIYTFDSGNKGYHITIYFDKPISYETAQEFYKCVLIEADLLDMAHKIEFRPTDKQGVKMPLGLHHVTRNPVKPVCNDDLSIDRPYSDILTAHKTSSEVIYEAVQLFKERQDTLTDAEVVKAVQEQILPNIKPLKIYELGQDTEFTFDFYNDLYMRGLKAQGTRHRATYQLILFFKSEYGFSEDECRQAIVSWMESQDKRMYRTPLEEAIQDTHEMVSDIYRNDLILTIANKDIYVSIDELRAILTAKKANGKSFTIKQRTVLFAILLHAKRFTNERNKVFFMTYDQITEATGYSNRAMIKKLTEEFEASGLVAVHQRNTRLEGCVRNAPNRYEVLFMANEKAVTTDCNDLIRVSESTEDSFIKLIGETFANYELRQMLPLKQAQKFYTA